MKTSVVISLWCVNFTVNALAQSQPPFTISTVAGNGVAGYSGDNGPASSAIFNGPLGVAVDGGGNWYVFDTLNNRIRKVTSNGTITTFAGTGAAGFSGDGGPAVAALLNQPGRGSLMPEEAFISMIRTVSQR
jgi:hypothetical protein